MRVGSSVFLVLMFICLATAQLSEFLEAFPHANLTAYKELEEMLDTEDPSTIPSIDPPVFKACPPLPVPADTDNVNNLRPGNIKVVMAMGDSITAAMSAKDSTFLSMKEYRGLAFSMGGDSGVTTIPNLLKPYVGQGYPVGASTGVGKRTMGTNGLNAAVSGAINIDLVGQAQWLVNALKTNKAVNMTHDWKLLTIWIGSNNLCDVCSDESNNNAPNFEKYVTDALEHIYQNVPRVFVNLLLNLDITQLHSIDSGLCGILHKVACGCVTNADKRAKVYKALLEYQQKVPQIAQKFASRNNPEFTVVAQPFLEKTLVLERSELAKADCFHPSAYSHGVAAVALWNNMISPKSQKKTAWSLDDTPMCATADTLLYTN